MSANMSPEGMILGGRYRIIKLIGSGGMADVYLASDLSSGMNVAIKILKQEFGYKSVTNRDADFYRGKKELQEARMHSREVKIVAEKVFIMHHL